MTPDKDTQSGDDEFPTWEEVAERENTEVWDGGSPSVQYHEWTNEWIHIATREQTLWLSQESAKRLRDDLDRLVDDSADTNSEADTEGSK